MYRTPFTHNRQSSRYDGNNPFITKPKLPRTPFNASESLRCVEVTSAQVNSTATPLSKPITTPGSILTPFEFHKFVRAFRSPTTSKPAATAATAVKTMSKTNNSDDAPTNKENRQNNVSITTAATATKKSLLNHLSASTPRKFTSVSTSAPTDTVTKRTPPRVATTVAMNTPTTLASPYGTVTRTPPTTKHDAGIKSAEQFITEELATAATTAVSTCAADKAEGTPFKPRKVLQRTPPLATGSTITDAAGSVAPNIVESQCGTKTNCLKAITSTVTIVSSTAAASASASASAVRSENSMTINEVPAVNCATAAALVSQLPVDHPPHVASPCVPPQAIPPQSIDTTQVIQTADASTLTAVNIASATAAADLSVTCASIATLAARLRARSCATALLQMHAKQLDTASIPASNPCVSSVGTNTTPAKTTAGADACMQTSPLSHTSLHTTTTSPVNDIITSNEEQLNDECMIADEEPMNFDADACEAPADVAPASPLRKNTALVPLASGMLLELLPTAPRAKKNAARDEPATTTTTIVASAVSTNDEIVTLTSDEISECSADTVSSPAVHSCSLSPSAVPCVVPSRMHLELLPVTASKIKSKKLPVKEVPQSPIDNPATDADNAPPTVQSNAVASKQKKRNRSKDEKVVSTTDTTSAGRKRKTIAVNTTAHEDKYAAFTSTMLPIVSAQHSSRAAVSIVAGMWDVMTEQEKHDWKAPVVSSAATATSEPTAKKSKKAEAIKRDKSCDADNGKKDRKNDKRQRAIEYCRTLPFFSDMNTSDKTAVTAKVNTKKETKAKTSTKQSKKSKAPPSSDTAVSDMFTVDVTAPVAECAVIVEAAKTITKKRPSVIKSPVVKTAVKDTIATPIAKPKADRKRKLLPVDDSSDSPDIAASAPVAKKSSSVFDMNAFVALHTKYSGPKLKTKKK